MKVLLAVVGLGLAAISCRTSAPEPAPTALSQGNVQMSLVKGETTKAQVIDVFGAPNITTRNADGLEVWTYERNSKEVRSDSAFFNVFVAGTGSSGFEQSSRSMILIITFGEDDVVLDYDSRYSSF